MSQRGMKLARIRRMLGGGVPAAGVTRVTRRADDVTRPESRAAGETRPEPRTGDGTGPAERAEAGRGRPRTGGGLGFYRGVHRREAA